MQLEIPCDSCGAKLAFHPGNQALTCQYCNHTMEIEGGDLTDEANTELDLEAYLESFEKSVTQVERHIVHCGSCGAETELDAHEQSSRCPFCDSPIVVEQTQTVKQVKPKGLLPFKVEKKEAEKHFKAWLKSLWFAPNKLSKQRTQLKSFSGVYLPYWTYDCQTFSRYTGQRGVYYYVTVRRRNSEGKMVSTRERRTRWYPVTGRVSSFFDDVLVPATRSLPQDKLNELEPWDLHGLVDYQDEFLSGYKSETYQVSLREGYRLAKGIMDDRIREQVRRDIGGDDQRIFSVDTRYAEATFKHVLLPVWVSAYHYKDKLYQILVNARTGEVQGERPWSWVKITLAALVGLTVLSLIGWGYINSR